MDVGAAFVAESESAVLVEPGERSFDDPALAAETGAVRGALVGDDRPDSALAQLRFGRFGVIAAVAEQRTRTAPGPTRLATDGRDRLDQAQQL